MSALRKNEIFETHYVEAESSRNTWEPVLYNIVRRPRAEPTARTEVAEARSIATTAKNIALFLVSPFVGLAYVIAMPFVGAAMLAYLAGKAVFSRYPLAKQLAMMVTAPFIGLAMIVAAPFVGIATLGYMGSMAMLKR